jgi:energy-coupling factor transporter ATP-binding protein EcfA2
MESKMKIQSAANLFNERLKILIYGPSGSGKTFLARTINEPTLVISAESGVLSLAGSSLDVFDITVEDDGSIVPSTKRFSQMQTVYTYLTSEEAKAKYKWIFIDSLTEISQNLIESLSVDFPDRKDALVMYGENFKKMRNMIKAFRDLPYYNVVFTAISEEDKDQNGKRFHNISMIGKMGSQLPAYLDEVFYLHTYQDEENVSKRVLVTKGSDKAIAKDRSGKLNQFEEPNLQLIANKIRGANDQSIKCESAGGIQATGAGTIPSPSPGSSDDGHKGQNGEVHKSEVPSSGQRGDGKNPVP